MAPSSSYSAPTTVFNPNYERVIEATPFSVTFLLAATATVAYIPAVSRSVEERIEQIIQSTSALLHLVHEGFVLQIVEVRQYRRLSLPSEPFSIPS